RVDRRARPAGPGAVAAAGRAAAADDAPAGRVAAASDAADGRPEVGVAGRGLGRAGGPPGGRAADRAGGPAARQPDGRPRQARDVRLAADPPVARLPAAGGPPVRRVADRARL